MVTHYTTLGISETASIEEIRQAHQKLVRANNPIQLTGRARSEAEERLRAINNAFNVLKDPEKRRAYDATLSPPEKTRASRSGSASSSRPKSTTTPPPKPAKPPPASSSASSASGGKRPELLRDGLAARLFYALKWLWHLLVSFLKWLGPLLLAFLKWLGPLLLIFLKWLWPKLVYLLCLPFKALWWLLRLPGRFIRWMWNPR